MSESENEPTQGREAETDAERDLAEHERPDVGLIADEELPEDLQPTDDNPLAKNPDEEDDGPGGGGGSVEGIPDLGDPGAPA